MFINKRRLHQRTVLADRNDERFQKFFAETKRTPGVYVLKTGKLVLKVGMSGERSERGDKNGIGHRVRNHLAKSRMAIGDRYWESWPAFMRAVIGRKVTIHYLPCDPTEAKEYEDALLLRHKGRILWEQERPKGNQMIREDPSTRDAFTRYIAELIDAATDSRARP